MDTIVAKLFKGIKSYIWNQKKNFMLKYFQRNLDDEIRVYVSPKGSLYVDPDEYMRTKAVKKKMEKAKTILSQEAIDNRRMNTHPKKLAEIVK